MLYLLDASSGITVQDTYYSQNSVPEFWSWLLFQARKGICKIPPQVFDEITSTNRQFEKWVLDNRAFLTLDHSGNGELIQKVTSEGYGPNLSETELDKIGKDPFLIAPALEDPENCYIVTHETSKPAAQGANRKIPDICSQLGIKCLHTVEFIKELDFKTKWKDETPEQELALYSGPVVPELPFE